MSIQARVTAGNVATFIWPCGCSITFQSPARRLHLLGRELSDDFDVWDASERRGWRWVAETACSARNGIHGGYEIRRFRADETQVGAVRAIAPIRLENVLHLRAKLLAAAHAQP